MHALISHSSVALAIAFVGVLGTVAAAADKAPPLSTRFEGTITGFETRDKQSPPPQGAILLTGASNIVRWKSFAEDLPGYTVINRGFGGSQLADVAYYADRVIIPYRPKMVIVQAGGNDLASGKSPETILGDAKSLVTKIRAALPETPIAFLSISPSIGRWKQREQQAELNRLLKEYASQGDKLDFIDVNAMFLGPDGMPLAEMFVADGQHLSEAGFKARAKLILPHLPTLKE